MDPLVRGRPRPHPGRVLGESRRGRRRCRRRRCLQKQWIEYRGTTEIQKKDRHLFQARIGEYATAPPPAQLFVSRVETHTSR